MTDSQSPRAPFPFSAIVGQETLKTALLLNAVDSRVGGLVVRGEKGTAKSTAVRALATLLPQLRFNDGCRFSCDPEDAAGWCSECRARGADAALRPSVRAARVIELPVSATEDRVVGTLDLEHALKHGEKVFEPGLLADANRAILYVDEVNLLDDHLVDTLLDAAAMGVNTVEREGVSFSHPARFILVGTMNPEEGELRPQLLDRFGLCVDVQGVREPEARVEIVRRRQEYEDAPDVFRARWADEELRVTALIAQARELLPRVRIGDDVLYAIANLALTAGVDGHRADQVMARGAAALAALDGRTETTIADVGVVAPLVLAHRTRRTLFEEPRLDSTALSVLVRETLGLSHSDEDSAPQPGVVGLGQWSIFDQAPEVPSEDAAPTAEAARLDRAMDDTRRSQGGRRLTTTSETRGRYVRAAESSGVTSTSDIAFDASIRAAASSQSGRRDDTDLAISIAPHEVRRKVRSRKVGASIVFCVDASGSMGAADRMQSVKSAVLGLLTDAYQRRDRVALVTFRGDDARTVLAPTASVELASLRLRDLPTGGATPLAAGLVKAIDVVKSELRRSTDTIPWIVIITDGRGNVGLDGGVGSTDALTAAERIRSEGIACVVIDSSQRGRSEAAISLARAADARYIKLESLTGDSLGQAVRNGLREDG
ncbi:MAG: magnesium chelatase subunit D family protein [Coriobacteriia bacterium]|nr:magnesium chelatase subunit D family protein [Coriobacteriia bacterium]